MSTSLLKKFKNKYALGRPSETRAHQQHQRTLGEKNDHMTFFSMAKTLLSGCILRESFISAILVLMLALAQGQTNTQPESQPASQQAPTKDKTDMKDA